MAIIIIIIRPITYGHPPKCQLRQHSLEITMHAPIEPLHQPPRQERAFHCGEKKNEETGSCEIKNSANPNTKIPFFKDYIAAFFFFLFFFVFGLYRVIKIISTFSTICFFNSYFFLKRTGLLIHVIKCQKKKKKTNSF